MLHCVQCTNSTFWTLPKSPLCHTNCAQAIHVICFFLFGEQYQAAIVCAHTNCLCLPLNDILRSLTFCSSTAREFLLWLWGPEEEEACNFILPANSNYAIINVSMSSKTGLFFALYPVFISRHNDCESIHNPSTASHTATHFTRNPACTRRGLTHQSFQSMLTFFVFTRTSDSCLTYFPRSDPWKAQSWVCSSSTPSRVLLLLMGSSVHIASTVFVEMVIYLRNCNITETKFCRKFLKNDRSWTFHVCIFIIKAHRALQSGKHSRNSEAANSIS